MLYLSDSQGDAVIWIYWGQYFIGKWTVWADTIPHNTPPPTSTPYPTIPPIVCCVGQKQVITIF